MKDLIEYNRFSGISCPSVLMVGWVDGLEYPTGDVDQSLLDRIRLMIQTPSRILRGRKMCRLCKEAGLSERDCLFPDTEVWVRDSSNGVYYASPSLIVHYIEKHRYLPPGVFMDAVARWDGIPVIADKVINLGQRTYRP